MIKSTYIMMYVCADISLGNVFFTMLKHKQILIEQCKCKVSFQCYVLDVYHRLDPTGKKKHELCIIILFKYLDEDCESDLSIVCHK